MLFGATFHAGDMTVIGCASAYLAWMIATVYIHPWHWTACHGTWRVILEHGVLLVADSVAVAARPVALAWWLPWGRGASVAVTRRRNGGISACSFADATFAWSPTAEAWTGHYSACYVNRLGVSAAFAIDTDFLALAIMAYFLLGL